METKEKNTTEIVKPRSYVACLAQGMSFPFLHFWPLFRLLWPAVLLLSIAFTTIRQVELHILQSSTGSTLLPSSSWGILGALEVFLFLLFIGVHGLELFQLRTLVRRGVLPDSISRTDRHLLLQSAWRAFVSILLVAILFMLTLSVCLYATFLHRVLALPAGLLFLLVHVMAVPPLLEFSFSDASLINSFKQAPWRYWGRTTALLVITLLVMTVMSFIVLLPSLLVSCVDFFAYQALASGDTVDLPNSHPLLRSIVNMLTMFFICFAEMCLSFPFLFHWGAVTAIEYARKQQQTTED